MVMPCAFERLIPGKNRTIQYHTELCPTLMMALHSICEVHCLHLYYANQLNDPCSFWSAAQRSCAWTRHLEQLKQNR